MSYEIRVLSIPDIKTAQQEIELIGPDNGGKILMQNKLLHRVIKVRGLRPEAATIIKQEMLGRGGEAVTCRGVINCSAPKSDILMSGTVKQYQEIAKKLLMQPFGLKELAKDILQALDNTVKSMQKITRCSKKEFSWGSRTYIMGILNLTPDSFSDGGRFNNFDKALYQAEKMVRDGADIIDIGGESTRPGYEKISDEEEIARISPVLEALAKELEVPISVDTYKYGVAKAALESGADMLNDIWGLLADPALADLAAEYKVPIVLMHNQDGTQYDSMMDDILTSLRKSIAIAKNAGVPDEMIILDPGIGFGKDVAQNIATMRHLEDFKTLGYPILLGTSRKSLIGKVLDLPANERIEGTGATVALGIAKGAADIIRVHDVKEMARVAKMMDAMVR